MYICDDIIYIRDTGSLLRGDRLSGGWVVPTELAKGG